MLRVIADRQGLAVLLASCALFALAGGASATARAADLADAMYDPTKVNTIDLTLPQASVEALEAEPEEYVKGTFSMVAPDGGGPGGGPAPAPRSVEVRLKGSATFRPLTGKAAFKLKFKKADAFLGLRKMTLNSMLQDRSMTHETLSYELFRALGIPASRTGFALVRVNGESYGLYLNLENLDEISLPRWFASTQHLYEGVPREDVTPDNAAAFEVDEGDDGDLTDLEALIAAVNDNVGDWSDGMAAVADLEQMTRFWAVERYIGHWDGYAGDVDPKLDNPNNFYLHSDLAGLFSMMPWGTDQTWDVRLDFDQPGGLLFDRCLEDASCEALYVDALEAVAATVPTLELDRKTVEIATLLAPCQATESEQRREGSLSDIEGSVEATREFIAVRPADLAASLGVPVGSPPLESAPAGGGEQPCPPLPVDRPGADGESSTTGSSTALRRLHVGRARIRGTTVFTRVFLPSIGSVTQGVLAKVKGGWRAACLDRKHRDRLGPTTVHCRLRPRHRRKLVSSSLRLQVRVWFEPQEGEPSFVRRYLTVPRMETSPSR